MKLLFLSLAAAAALYWVASTVIQESAWVPVVIERALNGAT